ncbi:MAG: hypothetical protein IPK52_09880 [Chloroflexi bacterium]|nr:hypothetical protein [Chloroflexota bacterium]
MKFFRLVVLALLLVTLAASAQDLSETATIGNITVSFPAGFTTQELMPGAIGVIDPTDTLGVLIFTGDAIAEFGMPAGVGAQLVVESISSTAEVFGEAETLTLPNGSGAVIEAAIPSVGRGFLFAVDTEGGLIVAFAVAQEGELPAGFRDIAQAVVGSVVLSAGETPVATDTPPVEATPAKQTSDTPATASNFTGLDGETCPIPVNDMPKGVLVYCLGVVMTLPENWSLFEGAEELDTFASINRENFTISLSTTVNEISEFYNPESYANDVLPFIADTVGHTTFDPAEHVVTVIEEDGRTIKYYDPTEYMESVDDTAVRQVVFLVILNNDLFVTHTFTWVPSFAGEGFEPEIEQIVTSTLLADFYDGQPAVIEVDGETIFLKTATWSDSTYLFTFNEATSFIAICPAGGVGNEAPVWGTEVYTNDSSVCLAAAHSGVITLADGGAILVTMLPGQDSYVGSSANGVTTSDYGTWGDSFSVEAFELP